MADELQSREEMLRNLERKPSADPTTLDGLLAEVEEALSGMTEEFSAFSSRPVGSPHSQARLTQERQIIAAARAHAALSRLRQYRREQG